MKNFLTYIVLPIGLILLFAAFFSWVGTIEPLPPPEKPINITIPAILISPIICWLLAAGFTWENPETYADELAYGLGVFLFAMGWIMLGGMILILVGGQCNIWPWEPATCKHI